jgi:hypothetical protein
VAGLFGIGGHASHTDRQKQLKGWGDLSSLTDISKKTGQTDIAAGQKGLDLAQNYFNALLSNDPGKIAQAVGPSISALTGQSQQQRIGEAEFGNRSGGSNAAIQALTTNTSAEITNLINSLIPQAATQAGQLGAQREGLGLQSLTQAGTTAGELAGQAQTARQMDVAREAQMGGSIAGLLTNVGGSIYQGLQGGGGAGDVLSSVIGGLI